MEFPFRQYANVHKAMDDNPGFDLIIEDSNYQTPTIVEDCHTRPGFEYAPAGPNDPGVQCFLANKKAFLEEIHAARVNFTALDVFTVTDGRNGTSRPTAYLALSETTNPDERQTASDICRKYLMVLRIDIRLQFFDIELFARVGDSVTIATNPDSQGTLGGLLEIEGELYGMTCHHVAFSIKDYDDSQYCPFEKGVTAVYSPGILDWEKKRMLQNAKIAKHRENIDTVKNQVSFLITEESRAKSIAYTQSLLLKHEAEAPIPFENEQIATLFYDPACYDSRTEDAEWDYEFVVDWCLFKLLPGAVPQVYNIHHPDENLAFQCTALGAAVGKEYLYDETEVEVNGVFMGPLQNSGTFVWMKGGKSGAQAGVVGSIMSHVKMFRDQSRYSSEHVVLRRDGGVFSQPGDSGAWVISEQGKWVGMILGGNSKVQPPRTYISSATFVLDAIESRIGIRPSVPAPTRVGYTPE